MNILCCKLTVSTILRLGYWKAVDTFFPEKKAKIWSWARDLNGRDRDETRDLECRDRDETETLTIFPRRDRDETSDRSRDRLETETSRSRAHPWKSGNISIHYTRTD